MAIDLSENWLLKTIVLCIICFLLAVLISLFIKLKEVNEDPHTAKIINQANETIIDGDIVFGTTILNHTIYYRFYRMNDNETVNITK